MLRYCVLLGSLLFPAALAADPVYTYTATTLNYMQNAPGVGSRFSISGDGFSLILGANCCGPLLTVFHVGDRVDINFQVTANSDNSGAQNVNFGGVLQSSNNIGGEIALQGLSTNGFVIPPNPAATYTFPAEGKGSFRVDPAVCGGTVPVPCSAYAQISADFIGQASVELIPDGPGIYVVSESFAGTPVPEPASLGMIITACVLLVALRPKRLRKRYTPSQRDMPGISSPN